MARARRARAKLFYDFIGRDVSDEVMEFSYTDNYDKTDDISVRMENRHRRWLDEWFPGTGDTITAEIEVFDWNAPGDNRSLLLGVFEIDNPSFSDTFMVNGVAIPVTRSARSERKNRAWVNVNLSAIAGDISGNTGLILVYDTDVDPFYDNADQNDKSDLRFLEELCKSDGLCMKVTNGRLIVYEESKYEELAAVATIRRGSTDIIGEPDFSRNAKNVFRACELTYYCPKKDETFRGFFEAHNTVGHTLRIRENYNSENDDINLDRKARARLREQNKYEWTCRISIRGDIIFFTGVNVDIEGWGRFDGKYHIDTVTHNITNSGYVCDLSLRKCLEGY